jgi:ADP-ribosylglycohydrolase
LERYASELVGLLYQLIQEPPTLLAPSACAAAERLGFPLTAVLQKVGADKGQDQDVIGRWLSSACYIEHSLPSVLYLAARYEDDFESALVANTRVGGDNCHRGAVLGAILGADLGIEAIPERWIQGLTAHAALAEEIDRFCARFS